MYNDLKFFGMYFAISLLMYYISRIPVIITDNPDSKLSAILSKYFTKTQEHESTLFSSFTSCMVWIFLLIGIFHALNFVNGKKVPMPDAAGNFFFGIAVSMFAVIFLIYDNKKYRRPGFWVVVLIAYYFLRNSIIFYM